MGIGRDGGIEGVGTKAGPRARGAKEPEPSTDLEATEEEAGRGGRGKGEIEVEACKVEEEEDATDGGSGVIAKDLKVGANAAAGGAYIKYHLVYYYKLREIINNLQELYTVFCVK